MTVQILQGNCLDVLPTLESGSVQTCVTSPPYWGLRDYGVEGQLGLEKTPAEYVENLVRVFQQVKRVLRNNGTVWLNLGDSYAGGGNGGGGSFAKDGIRCAEPGTDKNEQPFWKKGRTAIAHGLKPKDLIGIPWRVAFALQADGWYLRQDIIWAKPNPMPESVTDRCTKSHEYLFLLAKSERYYFDNEAIREPIKDGCDGSIRAIARDRSGPVDIGNGAHIAERIYDKIKGANKRSVWTVTTKPFKGAHFATFPPDLIEPCILAGSKPGDTVLDPFGGAGTTGVVAQKHGRNAVLIELNPAYSAMADKRIEDAQLDPALLKMLR
jgi:DNA modification methylase